MRAPGYQVVQDLVPNGACTGYFFPRVTITTGLVACGPAMVAAALAHEFEHARRRHALRHLAAALFVQFIVLPFWWLPIWRNWRYYDIPKRLVLRHELEADQAVIHLGLQKPLIELLEKRFEPHAESRFRVRVLRRSLRK